MNYEMLQFLWWLIIGVLLIGFTITDGFDMGVGILLPWITKDDNERRMAINTIGPHWEGNQVWLVLSGGAIFAAWPRVYATIFSSLYLPMMIVLFALFFRPVGFDYRSKVENVNWRKNWDRGIFFGSFIPALIIGVAFGNLLIGFDFQFDQYMRVESNISFLSLLNPLGLATGIVSVSMLAASGGYWLQMKTNSNLAVRSGNLARLSGMIFILSFLIGGLVLIYTKIGFQVQSGQIMSESWLTGYLKKPIKILAPIFTIIMALLAIYTSRKKKPGSAFILQSLSNIGVLLTFAVTYFPFVVTSKHLDQSIIYTNASSSEHTLMIMTWVSIIFVPIVLAYTIWSYRKMWRKIDHDFFNTNQTSLY